MVAEERRRTPPSPAVSRGEPPGAPVIDIYARISRAANGETIEVDDQVEMGGEVIERRGGAVGERFKDNSLSAWNPRVVRRSWDSMMARLESDASDGVWVYDVSRFTRKPIEGERLIQAAAQGKRVWSNSGEYDLGTADGRAAFRDAVNKAAGESDKISERVGVGKRRKARRGRNPGNTRGFAMPGWEPTPPGWEEGDPRTPIPVERVAAERAVIRYCYDELFGGRSIGELARELNERGRGGEPTALPMSGKLWSRQTLSVTLRRPALAGLLFYDGVDYGVLAGVEPIVSREEWERMTALAAARKIGRPPSPQHPLSGEMLCGRCGKSRMYGYLRRQGRGYPDGAPRREYRCRARSDWPVELRGCGRNSIDARVAEEAVNVAMIARLADPRRAERVAAHLAQVRAQRSRLSGEIARLEATADDLAEKVAAWGTARVDKAMAPVLARISKLHAELATLDDDPASDPGGTAQAVGVWEDAVARQDIPTQRAMIKRAFPKLTLAPPRHRNDQSPERFRWDGPTT
ncbi:MAG TPA: recombinase family protein [Pseudonocardia sp.]|uniref:recombinase family protein n=1 Tax=Pseudonocardia sp. TaxID=60912 RepID=UPI002F40522A